VEKEFIIDNSIIMAWCFEDEANQYAGCCFGPIGEIYSNRALYLAVRSWECIILVAERRKRLSEAYSARFLALLNELPIIIAQEQPDRMMREILALAREHQLSTYDASYLDLAMKKGLPIA